MTVHPLAGMSPKHISIRHPMPIHLQCITHTCPRAFLTLWCAGYAGQAAECGSAYYRYGAALFYKAQDEADVFGGNLQDAAEKHDAQVASVLVHCQVQ